MILGFGSREYLDKSSVRRAVGTDPSQLEQTEKRILSEGAFPWRLKGATLIRQGSELIK